MLTLSELLISHEMTFSLLTRKKSDRGNISSLLHILSLFPASSLASVACGAALPKDCCYSIEPRKSILGSLLEFVKGHHCRMWNIQYLHLNSSNTLKKDWFDKLGTLLMRINIWVFLWRYCHTNHELPGKEVICQSSLWSYFLTLMIDNNCILDI